MKYLLLLFPILLISCMSVESSHKEDRQAKVELNAIGIKQDLTPEEQGFPEYIFSEENIEDMHIYLLNTPVPIEGAVKYEALKKRVPIHFQQFNTTIMEVINVDSFEYVNNIDGTFRYKVTSNSGEINFYKIEYIIEGYVSVPHFILDNDYFF